MREMTHERDREADIIKVAALLTAAPRWAGALLEADGVPALAEWAAWWRVAALLLSIGMAAVEGFALAYVLSRWRKERENGSHLLFWLAMIALIDFAVILAPYVAANVSGIPLRLVLGDGALLWAWSIAVAGSTGLVVASVGYAQRSSDASQAGAKAQPENLATDSYTCEDCRRSFRTHQALNAHRRTHQPSANGKEPIVEQEQA